jgi:hypothetical protein
MQSKQSELCCEVLRRLDREGVLKHTVLIGSWCLLAYESFFTDTQYRPGIRTRDIDLLIPTPTRFDHDVDLEALLHDIDFVISHKGRDGYIRFVHEDLMVEFIVPERGRASDKPFPLPELGVNAQPLRFMDFLADNTIRLWFGDVRVSVPHPANFALLKLIVSERRAKPVKRDNDQRQAVEVLRALLDSGRQNMLRKVFSSMPKKWQKTVLKQLSELPLAEEVAASLNKQ